MKISAVIPTRNRIASVRRTLQSLLNQTRRPDEIIVIDSSDNKNAIRSVAKDFHEDHIIWMDAPPAVCLQRNAGIKTATGNWIFLCDDDIALHGDYLEKLESYLQTHVSCSVVSGRLLQLETTGWVDQYPVKDFWELAWRFVFQLSVWGRINDLNPPVFLRPAYRFMKEFYATRKNTLSLAGWPLITQWDEKQFQTTIYSLGANLVRKDWLVREGYDEVLDPSGIGDNYGVAINFPDAQAIHVIGSTYAYHHKAKENRLEPSLVYYRRILALHYFFVMKAKSSGLFKTVFFLWSLFGNSLMFLFKRDSKMVWATWKAMVLILTARNPYWLGYWKGKKNVQPRF